MIIDAHTHLEPLADYQGKAHAGYGIPTAGLKTYLKRFEENGVDACFTFMRMGVRLESRIHESNDGLARARDQSPKRIYPWGTVHPGCPGAEDSHAGYGSGSSQSEGPLRYRENVGPFP